MPNSIKYNTSAETLALKKGNFYIGTGDVGKGPTSSTGYYNGITPPTGGYTIYLNKSSGGPSIYTVTSDAQLISLTNTIAGTSYTTVAQCLSYFVTQTDKIILNNNIPSVVTDNISLYLDVNSVSSYPQNGAVWYDLANGLQFNSQGTQTTYETVSGAKGFTFNDSGYWQCSSNTNLVNMGGNCTLIMWLYSPSSFPNRKTIFQKNGTVYASYQQEIAVTWENPNTMTYYSRAISDYDYAYISGINSSDWNMIALKMSTGLTETPRTGFYSINGGSWTSYYETRSNTALVAAADIVIGNGYAGPVSNGTIGSVICYNKMLSDSEILQNFNATKSTYGL
jgi:hypothetical protein